MSPPIISQPIITIKQHTTASSPRPHVLYHVQVTINGKLNIVSRRYSEFVDLHESLKDNFSLPPKRLLVTTFLPSAWVDDRLIAERKLGLTAYLNNLLNAPLYKESLLLLKFLTDPPSSPVSARNFNLEDALPSTLSRKTALALEAQTELATATTYIAAGYWPDWAVDTNPPEGINYSKFDLIYYAFATPNSSSTLSWDDGGQAILQRLVSSAHSSGYSTKIVLSVGGWGGSYWFSQAMSTSANRTTFINALASAVSTYSLDGIDIDWEYPNNPGAGNPYSSSDSANFLSFLTSLRSKLGTSKIISAAVTDLPWLGSNGNPLTNVAAYATPLTYINIMNYDVWGSSSTPGPNAPLNNGCGTSTQPSASAQAAYNQWTAAGFPANKMLLGLPLYGYVSQSSATHLTGSWELPTKDMVLVTGSASGGGPFMNGAHPRAKPAADASKPKNAAAAVDLSGWWGQQIPFNSLLASGALVKNSNGTYSEGGGFTEGWDNCSDTPFLFNVAQTTVVTYDDTYSLSDKAALAKQNGMAGCMTWSLDQDDGVTLQDAIRASLGKS